MFDFLYKLLKPAKEGFEHEGRDHGTKYAALAAMIILLLLQLLFGKYLWNNYLVLVVPGLRPLPSITYVIALSILYKLMF